MQKQTQTRGNVIVENIKVGDIHYEYDLGLGIKCEVVTLPKLDDGLWTWQSKVIEANGMAADTIIDYAISDINSENGKYNSQFAVKLYDYEAYVKTPIVKIKNAIKIKLTKLSELPDALHPNNIEAGFETIQEVSKDNFEAPEVGRRFNIGYFSTSGVQEIINENTFRTYSSIYKWEVVED
jgi:hypothetical protein